MNVAAGAPRKWVRRGHATFTAHAWGAVIRRPRPGRHTVAIEVVADFGTFPVTIALDVARGGRPDDEDADNHDHD